MQHIKELYRDFEQNQFIFFENGPSGEVASETEAPETKTEAPETEKQREEEAESVTKERREAGISKIKKETEAMMPSAEGVEKLKEEIRKKFKEVMGKTL